MFIALAGWLITTYSLSYILISAAGLYEMKEDSDLWYGGGP
jgi:hypothetical protein